MRKTAAVAAAMGAVLVACVTGTARADEAVVVVGRDDSPPPPRERERPPERFDERLDSALRLHVGPIAATTGRGLGPGLGLAADFGRGTLGFRLDADWTRGEPSGGDASPIAGGVSQYTGQLTLNFARHSALHPIAGVGFGYARVDRGAGVAGDMAIGTARIALEYALAFDDADVRFALGVTGALPGPADRAVGDVPGWAIFGATLGVGF
ncbi:MAG TPA: hypothetical protein VF765_20540 [Polyangiaceae bacterium]